MHLHYIIPEPPDKVCTYSNKRLQLYHKQLCPAWTKKGHYYYNTVGV